MLTPLRFYEIFTSVNIFLKANSKYDFFKYQGTLKTINQETLAKARGSFAYKKIAAKLQTEESAIIYSFENIVKDKSFIIKSSYDEFLYFIEYRDAFLKRFIEDKRKFTQEDAQCPMEMLMSGDYSSLMYISICDILTKGKMLNRLYSKYGDTNPVMKKYAEKIKKYSMFIERYIPYISDVNIVKKMYEG